MRCLLEVAIVIGMVLSGFVVSACEAAIATGATEVEDGNDDQQPAKLAYSYEN